MSSLKFCDNCNGHNGGGALCPVTVVVGSTNIMDSLANWPAGAVCVTCRVALVHLDFAEFIRRHTERPRTVELP